MRYYLVVFLAVILLTSCDRQQQATPHAEEKHEEKSETTVSITAEQAKAIMLQVQPIEKKNLASSIVANGVLTVPNQFKAHITSLYGGIVRSIAVQPGMAVRKGQAIATIVSTEAIQIQQEYLSTSSQLALAENELSRQKELLSGNATAAKRLQQAESERQALAAKKEGLSRNLEAIGLSVSTVKDGAISSVLSIVSPIDGTVSSINVQIGSNTSAGMAIADIVNNSQLHLDLFVFEKDLPKLKTDQVVHFTVTNNPGREYDAKIFSIGTAFSSETKTIPIHATVQGDKTGLIEGMNVSAAISIGEALATAVPTTAIVSAQGKDFIFVQMPSTEVTQEQHSEEEKKDAGQKKESEHQEHTAEAGSMKFMKIEVQKGVTSIGYTEIVPIKELPEQAQVVSNGAFFLLAKMTGVEEHED